MLLSLNIKNYAIIEHLSIEFNSGLNVLTGETGAGKSIIIGALSFALGYRSSTDIIRTGEDKVFVQVLFGIDAQHKATADLLERSGIACEDGMLIIGRELTSGGRNVCKINDTLVNVAVLREITAGLIDIHGQHEHQKLLDAETHLSFLDAYGAADIQPPKSAVAEAFAIMRECEAEYEQLKHKYDEDIKMKMLYRQRMDEITAMDLKVGEDDELEARILFLSNIEKIYENTDEAYQLLSGHEENIGYKLKKTAAKLDTLSKYEAKFKQAAEAVNDAALTVEDVMLQLRDYQAGLEFDTSELDGLQLRAKKISDLKAKYGYTIQDILDVAADCSGKLEGLDNFDLLLAQAKEKYENARAAYLEKAGELSRVRRTAASALAERLTHAIEELSIKNAVLDISFSNENHPAYREDGYDKVQFLISTNTGEALKPLSKIASGGEISRVMLAIKSILADTDRTGTLIFDEIDTGISGYTAQVVSEKMYALSASHQIICITHLTQLASMADYHYLISKESDGAKTYTLFKELNAAERVRALAQMLSGVEVTQTSMDHAEEMINLAKEFK
jgi:DNA repair protein RecN (Recombination protein N)